MNRYLTFVEKWMNKWMDISCLSIERYNMIKSIILTSIYKDNAFPIKIPALFLKPLIWENKLISKCVLKRKSQNQKCQLWRRKNGNSTY